MSDDWVRQIQEDWQWKIIVPDVNALMRSKLDVLGKDGMLVRSYKSAGRVARNEGKMRTLFSE